MLEEGESINLGSYFSDTFNSLAVVHISDRSGA